MCQAFENDKSGTLRASTASSFIPAALTARGYKSAALNAVL
jgi:hypothetical protein